MNTATPTPQRTVRLIPPIVSVDAEIKKISRQLRVAAYCRVSTKQEEQLNSYEVQKRYYTEKSTVSRSGHSWISSQTRE